MPQNGHMRAPYMQCALTAGAMMHWRSDRPRLWKSASSESSAQNSVQKNSPFAERQASIWPSFTGSSVRQNAQHVRASE